MSTTPIPGGNLTDLDKIPEIRVTFSNKIPQTDRPKITTSRQAEGIFRHFWPDDMELRESFFCIFTNRQNRIIGIMMHTTGSTNTCITDPKIIMATAIKANASGVIVAHNHPSGELTPSDADIKLTSRLKKAAELFDIVLLDHLILAHRPADTPAHEHSYYSFADEGALHNL